MNCSGRMEYGIDSRNRLVAEAELGARTSEGSTSVVVKREDNASGMRTSVCSNCNRRSRSPNGSAPSRRSHSRRKRDRDADQPQHRGQRQANRSGQERGVPLGLQRSPCRRRFRGCFEQRVSSSSPDEGYGGDSPQNIVNRLTAGGGTTSRSSKVAAPAQVTGRTSPMRSPGCVDTQIRNSSATRTSSAPARSRPVGG